MMDAQYCCIWCHTALKPEETYLLETGSTVCRECRGFNIPLTLWKKPCHRQHSCGKDQLLAFGGLV